MISREKTTLIHVAKKELKWRDEVYRYVLKVHVGVESSKDLDESGFDRIMKHALALQNYLNKSCKLFVSPDFAPKIKFSARTGV